MGLPEGDSPLSFWLFSFRLGKEMVVYSPEADPIVELSFPKELACGSEFLDSCILLLDFGALLEGDLDEVDDVILETKEGFEDVREGLVS
jgi:hypothetical protein